MSNICKKTDTRIKEKRWKFYPRRDEGKQFSTTEKLFNSNRVKVTDTFLHITVADKKSFLAVKTSKTLA